MSDDLDIILKEYGQQMVNRTADLIAADGQAIIANQEVLVNPEQEGSPRVDVDSVTDNSKRRSVKNWAERNGWSYPYPDVPRYATGALMKSIRSEYGDFTAAAGTDVPYARDQQEGNSNAWTDEEGNKAKGAAARPFLGVSDRALKQATAECQKIAEQFIAATNGITIRAEITISA